MNMKEFWAREKYVAIHAQSWKFRVVKYIILISLFAGVWSWKGGWAVAGLFTVLLIVALALHFVFRWKTNAWTQDWGPYKKLKLPGEKSDGR
jgi:hypothetical protein